MTLKKLRLFFLIVFISAFYKGIAENSIIIKFNNGTTSGTLVSVLDKITFSGSDMLVTQKDNTVNTFSLLEIQNMFFGIYSATTNLYSNPDNVICYPNPATDFIFIKNNKAENITIEIFGLDGSLKLSTEINSTDAPVNVKSLAKGLYILKANNTTIKLLKQ